MGTVTSIKSAQHPPRASQSRMETLIITPTMVDQWAKPDFQRPKTINARVCEMVGTIARDETIDGVITLGALKSSTSVLYIVDGQHRLEAFKLSGLEEAIADVRICIFDDMVDMSEAFVHLNTALVRMRPDDVLRGLEKSVPALSQIRGACEFIGYGSVRRGGASGPVVSMSALLRCWTAAGNETPQTGKRGAADVARDLDPKSISNLIAFLSTAEAAWKRDPEYYRLWGNLNLTLCMWLWNRLVIDRERPKAKAYSLLDIPTFKKCLMAVSAEADYLAWLRRRNLDDTNRSPAYNRLKAVFLRRLSEEKAGGKPRLPQPAWSAKI